MAKTAIVTGATRGIGRATAIALARLGYDVAITGRTHHEGDAATRPEAEALPELQVVSGSLDSTAAAIEAEGVRAAGEKLAFVAKHAAPVDRIGEAIARVLTGPPAAFMNGETIEVQDVARDWGILPARPSRGAR